MKKFIQSGSVTLIFIIIFFFSSILYGEESSPYSLRVPLLYQNPNPRNDQPLFFQYLTAFLSLLTDIKREIQAWCPQEEISFATNEETEDNLFKTLKPVFVFYYYYSRHSRDPEGYINSIKALVDIIDSFEPSYEYGHTERVAWLVIKLIEELKIQNDAEPIIIAALLHDLGKVFFPAAIFKAASPQLTEIENKFRKEHPVWGARILELFPWLNNAALNVRHHHERYAIEGGYPDGLKGETIPLGSRIIAVADVVDALLSKRVYDKERHNLRGVVAYMKEQSGKWFDPSVVDALLRLDEHGKLQIYETKAPSLVDARQVIIDYLVYLASIHSSPILDRSQPAVRNNI